MLELGQECGLDLIEEAIDNAFLHYNVFAFPITSVILDEAYVMVDDGRKTIKEVL